MPATLKEHLDAISSTPMSHFYGAEGITPATQAKLGKKLLEATASKDIKLKGWFDKRKKIGEGYRLIKGTTEEALIKHDLADNGVRLKAWVEICKQMSLYPKETVSVEHGFDSLVGDVVREILDESAGVPPLPSEETE